MNAIATEARPNVAVTSVQIEKMTCDLEGALNNIRSALLGAQPQPAGSTRGNDPTPEGLAGSQRVVMQRLNVCLSLAGQILNELVPR